MGENLFGTDLGVALANYSVEANYADSVQHAQREATRAALLHTRAPYIQARNQLKRMLRATMRDPVHGVLVDILQQFRAEGHTPGLNLGYIRGPNLYGKRKGWFSKNASYGVVLVERTLFGPTIRFSYGEWHLDRPKNVRQFLNLVSDDSKNKLALPPEQYVDDLAYKVSCAAGELRLKREQAARKQHLFNKKVRL